MRRWVLIDCAGANKLVFGDLYRAYNHCWAGGMNIMKTLLSISMISLMISGILCGCVKRPSEQHTEQKEPNAGLEIEALIEKLAISDQPAGQDPIYTPPKDTPRTDKRVVAYDAASKLKSYGKKAFPYLLKHFDDKRQSVAFRRVIPHDVGDACYCIICSQIFYLPQDYRGSFYRTGADGKTHERAYFSNDGLFTCDTIESWLEERKEKSLEEMQIEALQWLIEQEKQIGFRNEEDKDNFLYPLERQLAEVKKKSK